MVSLNNIEDYNMPAAIYITDATYSMVCALSGKKLPKTIVDGYIRFVWQGPNSFEFITDYEYEEKYEEAVSVGSVIFLASKG